MCWWRAPNNNKNKIFSAKYIICNSLLSFRKAREYGNVWTFFFSNKTMLCIGKDVKYTIKLRFVCFNLFLFKNFFALAFPIFIVVERKKEAKCWFDSLWKINSKLFEVYRIKIKKNTETKKNSKSFYSVYK